MKDIDLEQLIELARTKEQVEQSSTVQTFIDVMGIKEGREKIFAKDLHSIYSRWAPKPLTLRKFIRQMEDIIKSKNDTGYKYYRVNMTELEVGMKVDDRKDKKEQG